MQAVSDSAKCVLCGFGNTLRVEIFSWSARPEGATRRFSGPRLRAPTATARHSRGAESKTLALSANRDTRSPIQEYCSNSGTVS